MRSLFLVIRVKLTCAGDETATEPGLEVLVLQAFVDVLAAAQQRLNRLDPVEKNEGSLSDPNQVNVAELLPPKLQLFEKV